MKVGILTFHNGFNYGAFLQTFSLQKFLQINGFESKVINYKNLGFTLREYKYFLDPRLPLKILSYNARKLIIFRKFQNFLNRTSRIYLKNKLRKYTFDIVIIGSDEVWNLDSNLIGFDTAYFSENIKANRIFSYGVSFGNFKNKSYIPINIIKLLNRFDEISVRDSNSADIVKDVLGKKAKIVLDPTFLFNLNNFMIDSKKIGFILIYGFFSKNMVYKIKEFSKKVNLKLISVGYFRDWCDLSYPCLNPFEWLGFFKNCEYIITTMYHGMTFSIIYKKEFFLYSTPFKKDKIGNFLNILGINDRLLLENNNVPLKKSKINYNVVYEKINDLYIDSKNYLINNILHSNSC